MWRFSDGMMSYWLQIQDISVETEDNKEKKSAKDALLLWCQMKTAGWVQIKRLPQKIFLEFRVFTKTIASAANMSFSKWITSGRLKDRIL